MQAYIITISRADADNGTMIDKADHTFHAESLEQATTAAADHLVWLTENWPGYIYRVEAVRPDGYYAPAEPPAPTRAQLKRFSTWIGLFLGASGVGLLALLLSRVLHDLPWQFYIWMSHLQGLSLFAVGALIILASVRTDGFIRCENHVLLALADKVRARREELEGKEGVR